MSVDEEHQGDEIEPDDEGERAAASHPLGVAEIKPYEPVAHVDLDYGWASVRKGSYLRAKGLA